MTFRFITVILIVAVGLSALALLGRGEQLDRLLLAAAEGRLSQSWMQSVEPRLTALTDRLHYGDVRGDDAYWVDESASLRDSLPLYKYIPAANRNELALASSEVAPEEFTTWHRSLGDNANTKFSGLAQINVNNVSALARAWVYETPGHEANLQATPVYTGSLLVFPDARHKIVALDPVSGLVTWEFDPGIRWPARRGLVFAPASNLGPARIYFAAEGRLFALDASSGLPVTEFGGGVIDIGYSVKAAPAVVGNIILVSSMRPALHAYDTGSGKRVWMSKLRPGERADSGATGPNEMPPRYGGGNPWAGFAVDEHRGIAFVSTSNPTSVGVGIFRPGTNPGTCSVLAIGLESGNLIWAFQEIAHDLWDLDISSAPVLASITLEGRRVDVVATATKAGNTLLLDRVSGQPIFELRLRRAPVSVVAGERTNPYQPDFELPEPFARQEFSLSDVTNIGALNRASVQAQLTGATLGYFEPHVPGKETVFFGLHGGANQLGPALDVRSGRLFIAATHEPSAFTIVPSASGAAEPTASVANSAAFGAHCSRCHAADGSGGRGPVLRNLFGRFDRQFLVNIIQHGYQSMPAVHGISHQDTLAIVEELMVAPAAPSATTVGWTGDEVFGGYQRSRYRKIVDFEGFPGSKPPWGTLNALDLASGKIIWRVPLGSYPALEERGLPVTGTPNMAGPMVTAGGVVFVSGTKDKYIRAFDAANGKVVWKYALPFVGSASPMTFVHEGVQYVVLPATGGGTLALYDASVRTGSAVVAFRLASDQ